MLDRTQRSVSTGAWINRDLRRANTTGGSGSLAMRIRTEQTAAPGFAAQYHTWTQLAFQTDQFELDLVLPPGWGLSVVPTNQNTLVNALFIGRERPAPPPEIDSL
jgi:hypothetical protein